MDEVNLNVFRLRDAIENKMRCRDYNAARTLILEALKAFPRLDQGAEMMTVSEVLCNANIELPGYGIDWYWILGLYSEAELAAIETNYQKITSQLKRIVNDFPGTELALKYATDAFSVLSHPEKRAAFDSKRKNFFSLSDDSTSPISSFPNRAIKRERSEMQVNDDKQKKICTAEASLIKDQVNSTHICDPPWSLGVLKEIPLYSPSTVAQKKLEKDFYDFGNDRMVTSFSEGQVWAAYGQEHMPRRYGKIDKIIPEKLLFYVTWFQACPRGLDAKKWCDAGFPFACGTFELEKHKITLCGHARFSHMISNTITGDSFVVYPKQGEVWALYRDWDIEWCSEPKKLKECGFQLIEVLTDYFRDSGTKVTYLKRAEGFKNVFQRYSKRSYELSFWISADKLLMFSHKVPAFKFMGGEMDGILEGMLELDPLTVPDNLVEDLSCAIDYPSTSPRDIGGSSSGTQRSKSKLTPNDFAADQIWAVYDGPNDMPRTYVKVINVVPPNKVCVTFLEPHPTLDQEMQWVEDRLPMVCGFFRAGSSTTNVEMCDFSHLVNCKTSAKKSFYRIFPNKGEVWAMYKNWSSNWKSSDLNGFQCQMVEILSDFSEESGVSVCCLVEVQGYLTFFQRQRHDEFHLFKEVSRLDLLSFSHRIPAFTVLDTKNHDLPKEALHLEPNALPPKFVG